MGIRLVEFGIKVEAIMENTKRLENVMHYKETQYGFEYGAARIQRICSDEKKGWVTIGVETPKYKGHDTIQVYITRTGKVRIFSKDGEWKNTKAK
jgi:hypothetical protein